MPAYAYRAVNASGQVANGQISASSENELAHYLSASGMELIAAREKKQHSFSLKISGQKISPRILAGFCSRLHDLLLSGIPFLDALRDVAATSENKIIRDALMQIARAIANGGGIAASFALYPKIFPPVFVAIIGAGERSGDMGVIFDFLARYAGNRAQTHERLTRALRYPLFLFIVAGGATGFMMMVVVPQIAQFLNGLQSDLPLTTRVLIAVSAAFNDDGWFILAAICLGIGGIFFSRALFPSFAQALDALLLRLPVIGVIITKSALARFTHSFSILFRSGCDVPDCLRQAGDTIANRALLARIRNAEQRVQSGASLSQALDGIMPGFALGLLRIGERSGKLDKCLDDIAAAYDREAQAATDSFVGLLEPCLTLMIGGVLAWTVMAVLGPLYGSVAVLGGRM